VKIKVHEPNGEVNVLLLHSMKTYKFTSQEC